MQLHGEWTEAIAEAGKASARLSTPRLQPAAGDAFYQLGELYRLRGDFSAAEAAFTQASHAGRSPHPGLALVRLTTGYVAEAAAAMRREREEAQVLVSRASILPAFVEVMLAAGDLAAAGEAAAEPIAASAPLNPPHPRAPPASAKGAVQLAADEHRQR